MKGSGIRGALAGTAGLLLGITGIIRHIAGDGKGMAEAMERFAPSSVTGVPESAYPRIGEMFTGYLTGREESFSFTLFRPDGTPVSAFHDYEAAHMADCRGLISLDSAVFWICLGVLLCMLLWQILFSRQREEWSGFLKGARGAILALCGIAGALALWAVIDFDSLFILFHRIAFTNDLWLLDPRTDLLIRLMPQELFVDFGLRGLAWAAGWILLLLAGTEIGIRGIRRKDRKAREA